jgi:uncharacterized delta-60 repeat protein
MAKSFFFQGIQRLSALVLLFCSTVIWAQDGALDLAFDPGSGVRRKPVLRSLAEQPDGKILICGEFDAFNGTPFPSIARLNGDGLDTSFVPPWDTRQLPYVSGQIRAVSTLSNGRILIGGSFTANVNGTGDRRYNVAWLNTNGTVATEFYNTLASSSGVVNTLAVQSDGKILVGGCSLTLNVYPPNTNTYQLIRLNADGSPDYAYPWRKGSGGYIQHIEVFPYDTVYTNRAQIIGVMPSDDGSHTNYSLSLAQEGTEINSLDSLNGAITVTAPHTGGKRLVAGFFTQINGNSRNRIARLNPDNSVDDSFAIGTGANAEVSALVVQSDGKIVLAGGFTQFKSVSCGRLVRLEPDGSIDSSFNPGTGAGDRIYDLRVRANGDLIILGAFTEVNGRARGGIARLAADGTLLDAYAGAGAQNSLPAKITAAAVQSDGKILIGGNFTEVAGRNLSGVARLQADGSLDASFDPGTGLDGYVQGISLQPDGRILIAGYFGSANGAGRTSLARLNADGSLDDGFKPSILKLDGSLSVLQKPVVATNGTMLVLGHFRFINRTSRNYAARLWNDGSLDEAFNAQINIVGGDSLRPTATLTGTSPIVYAAAILPDAKVLVGGSVTWDSLSRGYLLRLDQTGAMDPSFVSKSVATNVVLTTGTVKKILPIDDGKILICGDFTEFKDGSVWSPPQRGRVARFAANGALDDTFNPPAGADNMVEDMALQSDGKILIVGWFRNYDALVYPWPTNAVRVARLNPNGELDTTFNATSGPDKTAYSVLWLPSNRALVTGDFTDYRGVTRPGIARIVAASSQSQPTGFAAWIKANFQPADPTADQTAASDPDRDGVPNMLEYAFGLNPKTPDRAGLPYAGLLSIDNQTYVTLTYLRSTTLPSDLVYEWTASADLKSWSSVNVTELGTTPVVPGNRVAVTARTPAPILPSKVGFYRLQVRPN